MTIICFLRRLPRRLFAWWAMVALGGSLFSLGRIYAANVPVGMPDSATTANAPAATSTPANAADAPSTATTATPTAPGSSPNAADAPSPAPATTVPAPHLNLPLAFADFAADYHPQELHPDWLTVQVGTLETVFAPPQGRVMFVLPELQPALADIFQPVEISCLLGAKSRFENVTQIDVDPLGHALGYSLPLGKIIYVLARAEESQGISFSFYYYESGALHWVADSEKDGSFTPITQATAVKRDLTLPADGYVFVYLSNRVGPPHPGSTAQPVVLYTYLIVHVHPVPQPAPALDAPAPANSSP